AFQRVFEGERFAALREAGCPVQRPLWASTGVKNPQYDETLYVYGLVGPHTVNTMPLPTMMAVRQAGDVPTSSATEDPTAELQALVAECRAEGLTDAVLLGMGGSSLAPEVFRLSFGQRSDGLRLHVLDSTDPDQIAAVEAEIDVAKTLFLVSTKSGGTIETLS